jgi:transketolase
MRKEFGRTMEDLARKDERVILLVGDIGYGIFDSFRKEFPDRFFNLGIREQCIVGMASGMALEGLKPYVFTITPFLSERALEQIKLDVGQQNTNVKIVGYADYPHQGPTHTELDLTKTLSGIDNLFVYFPKNSLETRQILIESYNNQKPTFISLKKDK